MYTYVCVCVRRFECESAFVHMYKYSNTVIDTHTLTHTHMYRPIATQPHSHTATRTQTHSV